MKINEMPIQDQINFWQRYIIVHSYIYYFMDNNIISDREYDAKALRLVEMKNKYPEEWKNSEYYEQYGDEYTGNTGFDLIETLTDRQMKIIQSVINGIFVSLRNEEVTIIAQPKKKRKA